MSATAKSMDRWVMFLVLMSIGMMKFPVFALIYQPTGTLTAKLLLNIKPNLTAILLRRLHQTASPSMLITRTLSPSV